MLVVVAVFPHWRFLRFPGYFPLPPALRTGFSGPWRLPPALSSTVATFGCFTFSQAFPSQFYRERYLFEWEFFIHSIFYLTLLHQHFWNSLWLRWSRIILCAYPHRVVPSGWRMDLNYSYCSYKAIDLSIAPVSHKV